jgi:hypothetical protein
MMAARTSIDGQNTTTGMSSDRFENFGDLDGEFARRHENESEGFHRLGSRRKPRQHRNAESERLSGSGAGTTAHVATGQSHWDRFDLDGERIRESGGRKAFIDFGRNTETGETGRGFHGRKNVGAGEGLVRCDVLVTLRGSRSS